MVRSKSYTQPHDFGKGSETGDSPETRAAVLIYNMIAVNDFSGAFARMNRPMLFMYQPDTQPTADLLKLKLGEKVRLERFDGAGHALFVDDSEKFNRVLEEFLQSLPDR